MLLFTLLLSLAVDPTPSFSQTPAREKPVRQQPRKREVSPAFDALMRRWNVSLQEFASALIQYNQRNAALPEDKRDKSQLPKHPAAAYWQEFRILASTGDENALQWLVEQTRFARSDALAAAEESLRVLDELIRAHPESPAVEGSLESLRGLAETVGWQRMAQTYKEASERSQGPDNQSRALYLQAWALSERFTSQDPKVLAEVELLGDTLIEGFPKTRATLEICSSRMARIDKEHLALQREWIATVLGRIEQHQPPESWPRQPMHAAYERYLPLSNAGHPQAMGFCSRYYPAFQQAERNGLPVALVWISAWIGEHRPNDPGAWNLARLGLVQVLTTQWTTERFVVGATTDLVRNPSALDSQALNAAMQPLLASLNVQPRAHANALYLCALSDLAVNDWAHWETARAHLEKLLAEHPTEDIVTKADETLRSMINVWPGTAAPDFRGTDAEGKAFRLEDYRGRVVLIDFVDQGNGLLPADVAARNRLVQRFEGQAFSLLGGLLEGHSPRSYTEQIAPRGILWRMALLGGLQSDIAAYWSVSQRPATFLVDPQGVIRARNLPWDQWEAEIARLLPPAAPK
jgi:outer membrane protein assembly factor BamD (BamD/ComL family)